MTNMTVGTENSYDQDRRSSSQKGDHTMKHIIFIILGAVTVMCLALATGYLQP